MNEFNSMFIWDGRLNRKKYLLLHAILIPMTMLTFYVFYLSNMHVKSALATGVCFIYFCLIFWMLTVAQIKRLHDRNKSAKWILLLHGSVFFFLILRVITYAFKHSNRSYSYLLIITIIPLLGIAWFMIETFFVKGSPGDNRFGQNPLN